MRVNHESLLTLKMIASKRERLNRVYKGPDFPEGYFRRSPCNCGVRGVKITRLHFGGRPYIRGWASHFNALLFRTDCIIRCEGGFKVNLQRLPAQIPKYCPHLPLTFPSCTCTLVKGIVCLTPFGKELFGHSR